MTKLAISKSIGFGFLGLTSMLCLNSCQKRTFMPIEMSQVNKNLVEKLDSFEKVGNKIFNDTNYICYGVDTIEFSDKLDKKLHDCATKNNPNVQIGKKTVQEIIPVGGIGVPIGKDMSLVTKIKPVYEKKYIDVVGIVSSNHLYTPDNKNLFVPVKYYGKINPKVKDK